MSELKIPNKTLKHFKSTPTPYKDVVEFIDSSNFTTAQVANKIGLSAQKIYNFKTGDKKKDMKKNEDRLARKISPKASSRGKERYNPAEKLQLVGDFDKLETDEQRVQFYREYGLYSSDISRWKEVIRVASMEAFGGKANKAAREANVKIEKLENEIHRKNRENERLEAIVDIQKKVSTLLGIK